MKRYLLTSTNHPGYVEVIYDAEGKLALISFKAAPINGSYIKGYKERIPVLADNIYKFFEETQVTVTEVEFEYSFEDFRREYPYKRNTHRAAEYWPKMTSGQQYHAVISAIEYRKYCERNSKWYKPKIADKWLKDKEYLNEWNKL